MKRIRYRTRTNASPREGERQAWGEYQIVDGKTIVGRYDTLGQASDAHPDAVIDIFRKTNRRSLVAKAAVSKTVIAGSSPAAGASEP